MGGRATRLVAVVLVLSAWPTTMGAIRGQSTLAAAALLGLSASASMASAETRAGALAGLAALKPTLVPLWLIRLAAERRWRSLAVAAAVMALLVALAALVVSPRAVAEYPAYLFNLAASSDAIGVHVDQMINWRGAAVRLGQAPCSSTSGWSRRWPLRPSGGGGAEAPRVAWPSAPQPHSLRRPW